MLRVSISKDSFLNRDNQVKVLSSVKEKMLGIYGDTKLRFLCECDTVKDFTEGMSLMARNDFTVIQDEVGHIGTSYTFTDILTVRGVNSDEVTISMLIDKYISLPLSNVALMRFRQQELLDDGTLLVTYVDYVYFYFQDSHYLVNSDYAYWETDDEGKEVDPTKDCLYLRYGKGDDDFIVILHDDYEYISATTVRVKRSYFTDTVDCFEYEGATDTESEALLSACEAQQAMQEQRKEAYDIMFEGLDSDLTTTQSVGGRIDNIEFYRDNFLYEYDEENNTFTYSLYFDRPIQVIQLPFTHNTATNLLHEMAVQQDFVDVKKAEAINSVIDMEKDVYHPAIATSNGFTPVYKLIFNLHFREHRGDDWLVGDDGYWNGTYSSMRNVDGTNYASIELMNESSNDNYGYFSYLEGENEGSPLYGTSYQSDLLTYLDFTNDDVRYQKNKIKKSFLRLSFYDSTNPANQNLLCYSTIFMDTAKLFTRYSKHFQDTPYSLLDEDSGETKQRLTGIRVNREPCGDLITTALTDDNDIETVRLSSQLVVEDKYNATSSSEGFYVYIWRDNESPLPQDLYLKVDFNHAGHGRSLPMMAPYWVVSGDNCSNDVKKGFKTFEEIVDDWNVAVKDGEDYTKKEDTLVGYGIQEYLRYSYIHFKYQYDVEDKQHYYYLDNEQYCDENLSTALDNTLILNLYEAKLSSKNSDDDDVVTYCYDCENMEVTLSYDAIPYEGGTVSPILTYALPYYNCKDDTKAPLGFLRETNSLNATIVYTALDCSGQAIGTIDGDGNITVESTNEDPNPRNVLCNVVATVTLEGCEHSSEPIDVVQDGAVAYVYDEPVVTLQYPHFPSQGGIIGPEYSYYQTYTHGSEHGRIENEDGDLTFELVGDSSGFEIDENGHITYEGVNDTEDEITFETPTVRLAVTMNDKTGYSEEVQLVQDFEHHYVDVYDDPVVELYYPNVSSYGGTVEPIYSYSQTWTRDNIAQEPITSGGVVSFSIEKRGLYESSIDTTTGEVTVPNICTSRSNITIGTVTCDVILNEKEGLATCNVIQEAGEYWVYTVVNDTGYRLYHADITYYDTNGTKHESVIITTDLEPNYTDTFDVFIYNINFDRTIEIGGTIDNYGNPDKEIKYHFDGTTLHLDEVVV